VSEAAGGQKFVEVAIAVVFDRAHQLVLVCQRKDDTVLPGYWEFPGGKCDPGEAPQACALREVREEVGIAVSAVRKLPVIEHEYPHAHVRLHPFVCEFVAGTVQLLAVAEARWVQPAEVLTYQFPEANVELVRRVAAGWARLTR
jgi:mutator protein MutT